MKKLKPRPDQLEALFIAADYFEEQGELRKAFDCLLAGAQGGDQGCQMNLGNFYGDGTGVRRDLRKAGYWYRRAYENVAVHGVRSSGAAHNYALDLYRAGNLSLAIKWFEKARALKDGSAMNWLAKIEIERRGVAGHKRARRLLNEALALEVRVEASEAEHEQAAAMLAMLDAAPSGAARRVAARK
jgi:TPR repeat protein